MTEWRTVEGYSRYKVSTDGEVFDTKNNVLVAKQLTGIPQYYYVNLNADNGDRKLVRVHRLVAQAFMPNPENFNVVDHIDRDKLNNKIFNLRWTDHSGNQRNTEGSIFINGEHILDFVEKYDDPKNAYGYIYRCTTEGLSEQEAVDKYEEYLQYGTKREKVLWENEDIYLDDLCSRLNKDYYAVKARKDRGWSIWNAVFEIPESWFYSVEISDGSISYWYPTKEYFSGLVGLSVDCITRLLVIDYTHSQIVNYDGKDHLRKTVLGFNGTMQEICDHLGMSVCSVETRVKKGMTLEEALTTVPKKIKKFKVNGVSNTPKAWCESFGIDPKKFTRYKSKSGKSILECFEYFGVDTSNMVITFGD